MCAKRMVAFISNLVRKTTSEIAGQQVATVPVLPPQYHIVFKELYDNAPSVPYEVVEELFKKEFNGRVPSDIFATFSRHPIASASIAQVHRATLKDGTPVAVKVQKPAIAIQIGWDLFFYRIVVLSFEKLFDLPLSWSVDYIQKHLRQEVDFIREGNNGERCARHINETASLKGRCYVPKVYWDYTSPRVLTAEWIDGIRFSDAQKVKESGLSIKEIMTSIVGVFSDVSLLEVLTI